MAFDFSGTFTASQFTRFRTYVQDQLKPIDARIQHLQAERDRVGNLLFAYDAGGIPTGTANDPPDTYCGKLFGAYEVLGGDVEFDLNVRSSSQPLFQIAGSEARPAQLMSNGEVMAVAGLGDAPSSLIVQQIKSWVSDDLKYRRGALERKIRRAIDYAEQLDLEIGQLQKTKGDASVDGSLAFLLNQIDAMIADGRYTAVTNDLTDPDPHGKLARAPVAGYMPGQDGKGTPASTFERTYDGLAKPQV